MAITKDMAAPRTPAAMSSRDPSTRAARKAARPAASRTAPAPSSNPRTQARRPAPALRIPHRALRPADTDDVAGENAEAPSAPLATKRPSARMRILPRRRPAARAKEAEAASLAAGTILSCDAGMPPQPDEGGKDTAHATAPSAPAAPAAATAGRPAARYPGMAFIAVTPDAEELPVDTDDDVAFVQAPAAPLPGCADGIDTELLAGEPASSAAPAPSAADGRPWPYDGVLGSPADLQRTGLDRYVAPGELSLDDALAKLSGPAEAPAAATGGEAANRSATEPAPAAQAAKQAPDAGQAPAEPVAGQEEPAPQEAAAAPAAEAVPAPLLRTGRISRDGRRRNVADSTRPDLLARRAGEGMPAGPGPAAAPLARESRMPAHHAANVVELTAPRTAASWSVPLPAPAEGVSAREHGATLRVLVCWVGKVDVTAAMRHDTVNPGPIRMLMERGEPFDRALLLSTFGQPSLDALQPWIGAVMDLANVEMRRTRVQDLTDHTMVTGAVMAAVEYAIAKFALPADGTGLWFHLSPGTPTTHAVLLLLASTRYPGIRLLQTRLPSPGQQAEVIEVRVPDLRREGAACEGRPAAFGDVVPDIVQAEAILAERAGRDLREAREEGEGTAPGAFREERGTRGQAFPAAQVPRPSGLAPWRRGEGHPGLQPLEGDPAAIVASLGEVYRRMEQVAELPAPLLLIGEPGCGRSRLARFIHDWSGRPGKFVTVDCAGLSDEMFACELFGQKPGDYPGAWRLREGAFRLAHQGTLFLQNVDTLSPTQQTMLMRVLAPFGETSVAMPGTTPRQAFTSRVRIVASARDDFYRMVHDGTFNNDLFYRLAGVCARLPAVRSYTAKERENLLRSFLVRLQARMGTCWNFDGDAWQALVDEPWPGNLRELSRMLQQICLLADADTTISREQVLVQLGRGRVTLLPSERRRVVARHRVEELARFPSLAAATSLPTDTRMSDYLEAPAAGPGASASGAKAGLCGLGALSALGSAMVDAGPADSFGDSTDMEAQPATADGSDGARFVLGSGASLDEAVETLRRHIILSTLERTGGNRAEAARQLGIPYQQFLYAVRKLMNGQDQA